MQSLFMFSLIQTNALDVCSQDERTHSHDRLNLEEKGEKRNQPI